MRGIILDADNEAGIRARWLSCHGMSLPTTIHFFYEVGQTPDSDEEGILVPGCCVWAGGGLVPTLCAAARHTTDTSIMQQVGCLWVYQTRRIGDVALPGDFAVMHGTFECVTMCLPAADDLMWCA